MRWSIRISKEAQKEYRSLDKAVRLQVLAGFFKIKYKDIFEEFD